MFSNKHNCSVTFCYDKVQALAFLNRVDAYFPVPLSQKVDLDEFVEKVLGKGHIAVIEKNGEVLSAAFFYCNDEEKKIGYLSVLATLPDYQGRGYAGMVLSAMEHLAKENGMCTMRLYAYRSNDRAVSFYQKNGYRIVVSGERLCLMKEL